MNRIEQKAREILDSISREEFIQYFEDAGFSKMKTKQGITFDLIDETITTISNGLFTNIETKRRAQDNLMNIVAMACFEYQKNGDLKRKIDAYWELKSR